MFALQPVCMRLSRQDVQHWYVCLLIYRCRVQTIVNRKQEIDGIGRCATCKSHIEMRATDSLVSHFYNAIPPLQIEIGGTFKPVSSAEICVDNMPNLPFAGVSFGRREPHAHAGLIRTHTHPKSAWRRCIEYFVG